MRRAALATVVLTGIVGTAGTAPAAALPAAPGAAQVQESVAGIQSDMRAGAQAAYSQLPSHVRNNPAVKNPAKQLGLVKPKKQPKKKTSKPAKTDPNCSNCVAITFDDGPAAPTKRLLKILERKDTHASFFVTAGNAKRNPQMLKSMERAGHTIGNHSITHRRMDTLDYGQVAGEIEGANKAIKAATGQSARWLRPPYGAMNDTVTKAARDKGMAIALWDVDTLDWKHKNPSTTCNVATTQASAGSIILMHDIHAQTVDAVECVIDGLRAKGLEPVALDRLLATPHPGKTYTRR